MIYDKLYKYDSKGRVRFWQLEVHEDGKFRSHTGIEPDGKVMTSKWKQCQGKNIGKTNATTPYTQAQADIESAYKSKQKGAWGFELVETKDTDFRPMLANKYPVDTILDGSGDPEAEKKRAKWFKKYPYEQLYVQPKFDGIRCTVDKDSMKFRSGDEVFSCPHIFKALEPLFKLWPNLVIDGELYNHEFRDNFNEIQSLITKKKPDEEHFKLTEKYVQLHVYDFFDKDNVNVSFEGIRDYFLDMIPISTGYFKLTPTKLIDANHETIIEELDDWLAKGYEGVMLRMPDMPYLPSNVKDRSPSLWKVKKFQDAEFEIISIEEGRGNWAGCARKAWFKHPTDENEAPFRADINDTMENCREILKNKESYVGSEATVVFQDYTPRGVPRFGKVKTLYQGKRTT